MNFSVNRETLCCRVLGLGERNTSNKVKVLERAFPFLLLHASDLYTFKGLFY